MHYWGAFLQQSYHVQCVSGLWSCRKCLGVVCESYATFPFTRNKPTARNQGDRDGRAEGAGGCANATADLGLLAHHIVSDVARAMTQPTVQIMILIMSDGTREGHRDFVNVCRLVRLSPTLASYMTLYYGTTVVAPGTERDAMPPTRVGGRGTGAANGRDVAKRPNMRTHRAGPRPVCTTVVVTIIKSTKHCLLDLQRRELTARNQPTNPTYIHKGLKELTSSCQQAQSAWRA